MTLLPTVRKAGGCGCCNGSLPYTVTISLEDFGQAPSVAPNPANISASFGSGAVGYVVREATGYGPITKAYLVDGGSCYAKYGRVAPGQPVIEAAPSSFSAQPGASGCTFTTSYTKKQETTNGVTFDYWEVADIEVSGGSGYDGYQLTLHPGGRDTAQTVALAGVVTRHAEPTLSLLAPCGQGADFAITLDSDKAAPDVETWAIASVSVSKGGSGYRDGDSLAVTLGTHDVEQTPAGLKIKATDGVIESVTVSAGGAFYKRGIPTGVTLEGTRGKYYREDASTPGYAAAISVTVPHGGYRSVTATATSGHCARFVSGAVPYDFSQYSVPEDKRWYQASVVVDPDFRGFGYKANDPLTFTLKGYEVDTQPAGYITVSGNQDGGPVLAVVMTQPGKFKFSDDTAKVKANVDVLGTSPTFGKIVSLEIEDAGDGYAGYAGVKTFDISGYNGKTAVMKAVDAMPLVNVAIESQFGSGGCITLSPTGARAEPTFTTKGCDAPELKYEDDNPQLPYWWIANKSGCEHNASGCGLVKVASDEGTKYYRQLDYDGSVSPVRGVKISAPGSGYAVPGRVEPTITLAAYGAELPAAWKQLGTGATITPTLAKKEDEFGRDYWEIESVAASGGTCYADVPRIEPGVTASVSSGSNAAFAVSLQKKSDDCGYDYWTVSSVAVKSPGCGGHVTGQPVTFDTGPLTATRVDAAATITATAGRVTGVSVSNGGKYYKAGQPIAAMATGKSGDTTESGANVLLLHKYAPTLTASVESENGEGALLSVTVEETAEQSQVWQVASVSVTSGGSGYSGSLPVKFAMGSDTARWRSARATATTNSGGQIVAVNLLDKGEYWAEDGALHGAKVVKSGRYYRNDLTKPPYVSDISAIVVQSSPSAGSGAEIEVKIDDVPSSKTFGQLKSAKVTKNGSGYTLLGGPRNCLYEGNQICLPAKLDFGGSVRPTETNWYGKFRSDAGKSDCENMDFTATLVTPPPYAGGAVRVIPGGTWNSCADNKAGCVPGNTEPTTYCDGPAEGCSGFLTVTLSGFSGCVDGVPLVIPYAASACGSLSAIAWFQCVGQIEVTANFVGQYLDDDGLPRGYCLGQLVKVAGESFASAVIPESCDKIGFTAESQSQAGRSVTLSHSGSAATPPEIFSACPETMDTSDFSGPEVIAGFGARLWQVVPNVDDDGSCSNSPPTTVTFVWQPEYTYFSYPLPGCGGEGLTVVVSRGCGSCGYTASAQYTSVATGGGTANPPTIASQWETDVLTGGGWPQFDDFAWTLTSCFACFYYAPGPDHYPWEATEIVIDLLNISEEDQAIIDDAIASGQLSGQPECHTLPSVSWTIE